MKKRKREKEKKIKKQRDKKRTSQKQGLKRIEDELTSLLSWAWTFPS